MPVNDRYPLEDVLAECRRYVALRGRKVYVEYVMLAGVNDSRRARRARSRAPRPEGLQGEPDPVQPDRDVTGSQGRRDASRVQVGAPPRAPAGDGAADARPRHRGRVRAAGGNRCARFGKIARRVHFPRGFAERHALPRAYVRKGVELELVGRVDRDCACSLTCRVHPCVSSDAVAILCRTLRGESLVRARR